MFIESISACGFLDFGKTRKFEFQLQKEPNAVNIFSLDDSTFIKAFSIIFDTKYGSECDLRDFINDKNNDKLDSSFVEVVLWESDDAILGDFKWLKNKRMTLVRSLLTPKKININGNSLDINIFHQMTTSLGFVSIDCFQMHRLLDNEITRLHQFSGDDLWSLVLKINECNDLVQIIEKKHKMRRIFHNQMEKHMVEMEEVLPLKVQARDEIRSLFQLTRRFKTLTTIASKRKLKILAKEDEATIVDLLKLEKEINEKNEFVLDLQSDAMKDKQSQENWMKLYNIIQNEKNDLLKKICEVTISQAAALPPELTIGYLKRFHTHHTISAQFLREFEVSIVDIKQLSEKLSKTQAQIEGLKWKLLFKEARSDAELKMKLTQFIQQLNSTKYSSTFIQQALQEINVEIEGFKAEVTKANPFEFDKLNIAVKSHNEWQLEAQKEILNLNSEIIKCRRNILEIDEDIAVVAVKGQADMSTIATLKEIEAFVKKNQQLSIDYLGPVFGYLKSDSAVDIKVWNHLKTVANIFLFSRGSTARKVNRLLVDSGLILGSYILLGIDEYVPSARDQPNNETIENIISAVSLIDPETPIKHILKLLLRDIVLVDEADLSIEELSGFPNLIVYSSAGFTTKCDKIFTIQSSLLQTSPIEVLQNIYDNVKKRLTEQMRIENILILKDEMEQLALEKEEKYQETTISLTNFHPDSSSVVGFKQILTALEEKMELEHRYLVKVAETRVLTEMDGNISQELIGTWDVNELKELKQTMLLQFIEEERELTLLNENMEIKKQQLKNSVEVMENLNELLSKSSTTDAWHLSIANVGLVELFQKQLDKYDQQLGPIIKGLQEFSPSVVAENQIEMNLLDSRRLLYKKNSEHDVIVNAMKLCQKDIDSCTDESNFNQAMYIEFRRESENTIRTEIDDCMCQIQLHKQTSITENVSKDQYGHLVQSIKKIAQYCESPERGPILRNKIAARTFPVINKLIVKMLKDAVHNYRLAFKFVMENFISDSSLFFYTHGTFDEVKESDFSWSSFDLSRLKAMDFVINWKKDGRDKISLATLRMVKALLLIMYIINYLSVFKFIIIDEKMFEDLDESLKLNIQKFFTIISPHVQIILLKNKSTNVNNHGQHATNQDELMEVSP